LEEPRFADTLEMKASQSFSSDLTEQRRGRRRREREDDSQLVGIGLSRRRESHEKARLVDSLFAC